MVADPEGNVYMYNKEGENLEGWTPRTVTGKLSVVPGHFRVRGKDFIYAVQENGVVNILNRRGEMVDGFPLKLDDKVSSPLFIDIGADIKHTKLTALTASGKLVSFGLDGKIVNQEQLYKPSAYTVFQLIPESSKRNYIILRQDFRRVAILNRKGEVLFEKDYLSDEKMKTQYYYFGSEKQVVAITDTVQDFTYLYDMAGNLINEMPLESGDEVGLMYSESSNSFKVYSVYNQKLSLGAF